MGTPRAGHLQCRPRHPIFPGLSPFNCFAITVHGVGFRVRETFISTSWCSGHSGAQKVSPRGWNYVRENYYTLSEVYRGTSLIRDLLLGPFSGSMPGPYGSHRGGQFLTSEVPLYKTPGFEIVPFLFSGVWQGSRADASSYTRGTLLTRNCTTLGSYGRPLPRALLWSYGGESFS